MSRNRRLTPRRLSWFGWFMGQTWKLVKIIGVVAVLVWLGLWIWAGGFVSRAGTWTRDIFADASASMGLRVRDVVIEGRDHIDAVELKQTIAVAQGDPLLGIDIHALHARLTAIPWVRDVRVRRAFPDRLVISIDERRPVALWTDAPGGPAIIDDEGIVLARSNLKSFGQLLAVEGKGASTQAGKLINLLRGQPDIAVRVKKAIRVSERRWDLAMDGGTVIRLPEDDPGFALARASKAQIQEKILDQHYKAIDLRQSDRIILENRPGDKRDLLLKGGDPV